MKRAIKIILGFLIIFTIWYLISLKSNPLFVPNPLDVLKNIQILTANGMLLKSIVQSFIRITMATTISCAISVPLALLLYSNKVLDKVLSPIANVIRYLPVTAFGPLLILWVGIGESMKITYLFCATFFYFLPSMVMCVKDVDKRLIETAYTMGMTNSQVISKVVLPYTLPSICESVLIMYGIGWSYIVVAEASNATSGLGYLINIGSARGRTDMVFMSIMVIMIISFFIDKYGLKAIKKAFAWKYVRGDE